MAPSRTVHPPFVPPTVSSGGKTKRKQLTVEEWNNLTPSQKEYFHDPSNKVKHLIPLSFQSAENKRKHYDTQQRVEKRKKFKSLVKMPVEMVSMKHLFTDSHLITYKESQARLDKITRMQLLKILLHSRCTNGRCENKECQDKIYHLLNDDGTEEEMKDRVDAFLERMSHEYDHDHDIHVAKTKNFNRKFDNFQFFLREGTE